MPAAVILLLDVLLALGVTARLTRLVVADSLGGKWFRWPAQRWANRTPWKHTRRQFWVDGLGCPFCVSTWIGIGSFTLLWAAWTVDGWLLTGWRIVAAGLTASYLLSHLAVSLGDVTDDPPDLFGPEPDLLADDDHPDAYRPSPGPSRPPS